MGWRAPDVDDRMGRWQARLTFWSAALMPPYMLEDVFVGGPHTHALIGIKLGWGAALFALGWGMKTRFRRAALLSSGLLNAAGVVAITFVHGGHRTPYFAWLFALPFCVVAMVQHEVWAAAAGSATSSAGALVILFRADLPPAELSQWALCVVSVGALAVWASSHLRQLRRDEQRHASERIEAQRRLAEGEQRLAQAERMATVGTLAAGVAHEINNPLASVIVSVGFLRDELEMTTASPEELRLVALEAQVGLQRIKGIVSELTAFSREGVAGDVEVDLCAVVDEAERNAAARTGHRIGIQSEIPSGLPKVLGNPRHLTQVFLNLLINAADAFDESQRTDGQIWIRVAGAADGVTVDVEDNGPGLSESVMKRLFVPFFTTRAPKRTGLGLATSREYLRRAGGDLIAHQRDGGGARFRIALRTAGH